METVSRDMAAIDYNALTKAQKIAAFLIVIGPDAAAEVIRHFENPELELICRELASLDVLDEATQQAVLQEFAGVVSNGATSLLGGLQFAQTALEKARGATTRLPFSSGSHRRAVARKAATRSGSWGCGRSSA
jgi:flagellar motor switch protein FliG